MIITAIQKGSTVYVYNEKNSTIFTVMGELHGYTSTTVTVKKGTTMYTYNERGSVINTRMVR